MPRSDRAASRKSEARATRRGARTRDDAPLLHLVQSMERPRKPVRAAPAPAKPLTAAQARYDAAIASCTLVFGIGPAGTGKTWLAATRAAERLKAGEIERIIVTRPTVEAGSTSLGFLPGELEEKMEPYFRPVRDALEECLGAGPLEYHLKAGVIEARPVQFVRGATFKNAFVLVDEAQNLTPAEMKLLLTRIGENCTVVVDGDPDQQDIPGRSGLMDALERMGDHPEVGVARFTVDDVVRSGVVADIIKAYARKLYKRHPPVLASDRT